MSTRNELEASIEREIALVKKARDELKLQLGLAKAEATSEWKKLEATYLKLEDELKGMGQELRGPAEKLGSAAKGLLDELGRGYARFKDALKGP